MNQSICGANCEQCAWKEGCQGCAATCGRPFGGACVAAQYIRVGGKEAYAQFKDQLLGEVNALLRSNQLAEAEALYELPGAFVNLEYPLPSGQRVKLLDDKRIYLGCQIEFADLGVCYGVVADTGFLLLCSYSRDGSEPELIAYKKR